MRIDYYSAVNWTNNSFILWNDIINFDEEFFPYDGEDTYKEFFQFFISDCSEFDVEFLKKNFPELCFAHSPKLDKWILCVDHYGTDWTAVFIDVNENGLVYNVLKDEGDVYFIPREKKVYIRR